MDPFPNNDLAYANESIYSCYFTPNYPLWIIFPIIGQCFHGGIYLITVEGGAKGLIGKICAIMDMAWAEVDDPVRQHI